MLCAIPMVLFILAFWNFLQDDLHSVPTPDILVTLLLSVWNPISVMTVDDIGYSLLHVY